MTDKMKKAALLDACAEGDLPKVKKRLAQGCLPNGEDHENSAQNSQVIAHAC